MRNIKRLFAMALTILMVVGGMAIMPSAKSFPDVTDYAQAVDLLSEVGIIRGYTDNEFGPDDNVTRWQMALLITKLVNGDVRTETWEGQNYTTFRDIKPEHYFGSISYANQLGLVKGTSKITFEPENGITLEDAFTIGVRALGYGSAALDATYPWSYIDKATKLGLDAGLEDVSYKATLTRGQTAQLLYNVFLSEKSNGSTFAVDVFGLQSAIVVISGSDNLNMLAAAPAVNKTAGGIKYVAFNKLAGDGTLTSPTYHLPISAFGLTNSDIYDIVGASFAVLTNDNFKSLIIAKPAPSVELTQDKFVATDTALTVNGQTYNLVNKFSSLYNEQGTVYSNPELIVYSKNSGYSIGDLYLPRSNPATGDYLRTDGSVALKANRLPGTTIVNYYTYAIPGTAIQVRVEIYNPDGTLKDLSVYGVAYSPVISTAYLSFQKILNPVDIRNINGYSEVVIYDDNFDGTYDRAIYEYLSLGKYIEEDKDYDGIKEYMGYESATVRGAAVKHGDYVLYTYNAQANVLTVKEVLPVSTGLVSEINNLAGTATFGSIKMPVGKAYLAGLGSTAATMLADGVFGKYVTYIVKDGRALYVVAPAASSYVVFDSIVGYQTNGQPIANVFDNSNIVKQVTIASIDGLPYTTWVANPWLGTGGTIPNSLLLLLTKGQLLRAAVDANGYYHLYKVPETEFTAKYTAGSQIIIRDSVANYSLPGGAAKSFIVTPDTVFIAYHPDTGHIQASKGIPNDYDRQSEIIIKSGAKVMLTFSSNNPDVAKLVYVSDGSLNGFEEITSETVVYVDADSYIGSVTYEGLGSAWEWNNLVDVKTGALVSYKTYSNLLQKGNFYNVRNGYIQNEVVNLATEFVYGELIAATYTSYTIDPTSGPNITRSYVPGAKLFWLDQSAKEVLDTDPASNVTPKNFIGDPMITDALANEYKKINVIFYKPALNSDFVIFITGIDTLPTPPTSTVITVPAPTVPFVDFDLVSLINNAHHPVNLTDAVKNAFTFGAPWNLGVLLPPDTYIVTYTYTPVLGAPVTAHYTFTVSY